MIAFICTSPKLLELSAIWPSDAFYWRALSNAVKFMSDWSEVRGLLGETAVRLVMLVRIIETSSLSS